MVTVDHRNSAVTVAITWRGTVNFREVASTLCYGSLAVGQQSRRAVIKPVINDVAYYVHNV